MRWSGVPLAVINFDYSFLLSNYTPSGGAGAELVKTALSGRPLINVAATKAQLGGAEEDYAELFSLYNGLSSLEALAQRTDARGVGDLEKRQIARRFAAGMKELSGFVDTLKLDKMKLVRGDVGESAKSASGVRRDTPEYKTGVVHTGDRDTPVAAWAGEVQFAMTITSPPVVITSVQNGVPTTTTIPSGVAPKTVNFDLAELGGAETRTVGAVVNYMNAKLKDAGVQTQFERERIPGEARTVKVGDKTVTLPAGPDSWTLKIKGALSEVASFTAPKSADAVYLAQTVGEAKTGDAAAQSRELLKFQTDITATAAPAAVEASGANWVEGRVFSRGMDPDIAAVRASAAGADGSVYMVAELTGVAGGQDIKGERDVALLKYDSAGQLMWSRTLGAVDAASGTAIAVSADGKVAIGGSVTGGLRDAGAFGVTDPATTNAVTVTSLNAAEPDSFVTVFDAEGSELWTRRRGAIGSDEVRSLAFGADGAVYAAGAATGAMPGAASAPGESDAWVRGWDAQGSELWTHQFGTAGADAASAVAVEGSALVVAGVENGRAVVRRFDLAARDPVTGVPAQTAVRDLGDLMGGAIAGVAIEAGRVTLAGTSRNGALNAGATTRAHGGGRDAFVASLDASLAAGASDRVSYWGGAGEDIVSAVTLRGGQAWIAGSSTGEIAGTTRVGTAENDKDGFVARLDAATGGVGWVRRWSAKDGEAAPSAIAVGQGGASVLDRLGLPSGTIDYTGAQEIAASTAARTGDRFFVRVNGGRQIAVSLEPKDTLKTLAERINRALGFNARAEVVRSSAMSAPDGTPLPGTYERLEIKARNGRSTVELIGGEAGRDLLGAMGLMEGTVLQTARDSKGKEITPDGGKTYGLKLARDLKLDTKEEIKRTLAELDTAKNTIRTAYRALADALKPPSGPAITGQAPAWMQKQAANYQAALSRLGGG